MGRASGPYCRFVLPTITNAAAIGQPLGLHPLSREVGMSWFRKSPEEIRARGAKYAMKGQFDRAIVDFDEAIRLNPTMPSSTQRCPNGARGLHQMKGRAGCFDRDQRLLERIGLHPDKLSLGREKSLHFSD
jgi:hypothetical protein